MKALRYSNWAIIIVLTLFSSCSMEERSAGRLVLTFEGEALTKGTVAGVDDEQVYTLDAMAFSTSDGTVENSNRDNGNTVSLEVSPNIPLDYYVVANAPKDMLSGVTSKTEFLGLYSLLSDNGTRIVMMGSGNKTFTQSGAVTVNERRYVNKVSLGKVTPSFLEDSYIGSDIKLKRVYLINVLGSCSVGATPSYNDNSPWYNRTEWDEATPQMVKPLVGQTLDMTLSGGVSVTADVALLCSPNPTENDVTSDTAPEWSPRRTRLVIELTVDDTPMYYPITLPRMSECNTHYVINEVILLGPGSDDPDIPVKRDDNIAFSVTVNAWDSETQNINY